MLKLHDDFENFVEFTGGEAFDVFDASIEVAPNVSEDSEVSVPDDSGTLALHELVNELFEPWEQVDESHHSLLAIALQSIAEGIPTPHVGTGAGSSSSDLPWNDDDKDKYQRPKSKGRR